MAGRTALAAAPTARHREAIIPSLIPPTRYNSDMKSRRVLLVLVVLAGFYYVTTHLTSTGALAPWAHRVFGVPDPNAGHAAITTASSGVGGEFGLTEASAAP